MRIALLVNNVPKEMLTIAETLHQKLVEDGTFLVGFDIVGASCWRSVYTRRASDHSWNFVMSTSAKTSWIRWRTRSISGKRIVAR